MSDDDDDFQDSTHSFSLTQTPYFNPPRKQSSSQRPLKPSNSTLRRPSKKMKCSLKPKPGKENAAPLINRVANRKLAPILSDAKKEIKSDKDYSLSLVESSIECSFRVFDDGSSDVGVNGDSVCFDEGLSPKKEIKSGEDYGLSLGDSSIDCSFRVCGDGFSNMGVTGDNSVCFDEGLSLKKEIKSDEDYSLNLTDSSIDCSFRVCDDGLSNEGFNGDNSVCFDGGIDKKGLKLKEGYLCNSIESKLLNSRVHCNFDVHDGNLNEGVNGGSVCSDEGIGKKGLKLKGGYLCNSIESKLLNSRVGYNLNVGDGKFNEDTSDDFEPGTQLDELLKLCSDGHDQYNSNEAEFHWQEGNGLDNGCSVCCPLCGIDISGLSEELRQVHTNDCLDKGGTLNVVLHSDDPGARFPGQVDASSVPSPHKIVDVTPVLDWLHGLGLAKYEEAFVREEIDWDTLQWLTEEDLFGIGITALGPRKKIVHALSELRKGTTHAADVHEDVHALSDLRKQSTNGVEIHTDVSKALVDRTSKEAANMLITDYFPGSTNDRNKGSTTSRGQHESEKSQSDSRQKRIVVKTHVRNGKVRDIPLWCCIPGTPFRVDAFRYLRRDCSHWFLTHFHLDHYQGLTRSFCHGKIYCSSITARLVNMKIGIPWDRLQVLPLNQKISIGGIEVTCLDANHCPGSIIILFEPPNGKAVLHTGDFRFCEEIANMSVLQTRPIDTVILDTTYCNPQYDFPKQEAVIQFVIEAIQAEAFNPKTLFLIGSYTIGKERLFLEVARVLRKKVYVNASKLRLLKCLGFPEEDMQWFTLNEWESHIHVVPMWTLASFKRLKHISNQYASRFNLIVAFSPTGWTFGKGKKKSPGRRWQQGTLIRYEVPYSEHCSFTELKEFVKFASPVNIVPSVNNDGPESAKDMVALLLC